MKKGGLLFGMLGRKNTDAAVNLSKLINDNKKDIDELAKLSGTPDANLGSADKTRMASLKTTLKPKLQQISKEASNINAWMYHSQGGKSRRSKMSKSRTMKKR
jgi:hypothetical protein